MRRFLSRGVALAAGILCGCEALYGGYSVENRSNCVINTTLCSAEQACNPKTRECEPAMVLSRVEPPAAPTSGGEILSISGQRFTPDLRVRIGGIDAGPVTWVSESSLTVVAPASLGTKGPVAVELIHPAGQTVQREGLFRYYPQTQLAMPQTVALLFEPRFLRTLDLNGDGRSDVLMTDRFDPMVYALLGQADGTLSAPIASPLAARAFSLGVGDVNGDGKPDLAVSQTGPMPAIEVAVGRGDGSFVSSAAVGTASTLLAVGLGDVSGDGKADLLALDDRRLRIWQSRGDGTFAATSQDTLLSLQSFGTTSRLLLHDLNGDGALDILAVNGFDLSFPILYGNGAGGFTEVASPVLPAAPSFLAVGDASGDGLPDVLAGLGSADPSFALTLQAADRSLRQPTVLAGPRIPNSAEILDLNGDGVTDLVMFSVLTNGGGLAIAHAVSPGRFAVPTTYSLPPFPSGLVALPGGPLPSLLVVHRGAGGSGNFYSILANVTP